MFSNLLVMGCFFLFSWFVLNRRDRRAVATDAKLQTARRILPVLFWTAFVLTRPLGATAGDLLWKPHDKGGLGLGSANVSYGLLALIGCLTLYSAWQQRQEEEERAVFPRSAAA